jgi:membrane fusion protein (multidrug efflux system)
MNSELNQAEQNPAESVQHSSQLGAISGDEEIPAQNGNRKRSLIIFGVVLAIAASGAFFYWLHARQFEETDDAQIDANLSPIGTRVEGTVSKVYVDNNQVVHAGDPLVDLDPRDYQARLDQAKAQLAQAESALSGVRPNVPITEVQNSTSIVSAKADVAGALAAAAAAERDRDQVAAQVLQQEAANARAQKDVERYRQLAAKQEISKSDFDQYDSTAKQHAASLQAIKAAFLAAERVVDLRRAQLDQARSGLLQNEKNAGPQLSIRQSSVAQQLANLQGAQAQLEQAQLNLEYTKMVAPVAGVVMKRSAQIGARVSPGQQLVTISQTGDLWVTANFKETQLLHMKTSQAASIHVDALDRDFTGTVETIGGATGSIASVLPPENATGNFVKVVQRIPVRIKIDPNQKGLDQLRPGMSVEPKVQIR